MRYFPVLILSLLAGAVLAGPEPPATPGVEVIPDPTVQPAQPPAVGPAPKPLSAAEKAKAARVAAARAKAMKAKAARIALAQAKAAKAEKAKAARIALLRAKAANAARAKAARVAALKAKAVKAARAKAFRVAALRAKAAKAAAARARMAGLRLASRGGPPPHLPPVFPDGPGSPPGSSPSQVPGAALSAAPPVIVLRTNGGYDARIDLKTDIVVVGRHGAPWEETDRAALSWRAAGYPIHRKFSVGSDVGALYSGGKADGRPHPDEIDRDAAGAAIMLGDRTAMVPTPGWLAYSKEQIRRAIDAGAAGVWPDEAVLNAAGGYSPAFKAAWAEAYGSPWQPPHESSANYFRASRIKADLTLRAVDELLRFTREYARQKGREVKFFLPAHSPDSYASGNLIFAHAAASRLPVDGLVAQAPTGPARSNVTYEGKTTPQVFESSWMTYSYFANLMDGLPDKSLYFMADAARDEPGSNWSDYQRSYQEVLTASLLFPQARGHEVLPRQDRVTSAAPVTPGTGSGQVVTAAPARYPAELPNLGAALRELPEAGTPQWTTGTRGIGVLTLDTMMWQRGGPQGSSLRSLHGLVLPLLKRGIPVQVVPAERVADAAFLSRFKVLLLSYDMQKPLGPEVNQGISTWVKAGGCLVLFGGEDPYNDIGEWWSRSGFHGPTEHLLSQCGAAVNVALRSVRQSGASYKEALKAEGASRALENRKVHSLPLAPYRVEGKPVYVRFTDLSPGDGWGAW
ncbi:MAG TPA: hypothetical protein VK689_14335, partial [Armatimonadota bacterium]|nr:hypothetical protein [Armatimonadota bacterium]